MITTDLVITYLANIIHIVQRDGRFDPAEQEALGEICKRLGTTEAQMAEALEKAAADEYQLAPVGRFSDKIQNLEDMLFVAMVDGDMTPPEKSAMLAYVKKIGLTQDQVKTIVSETRLKINLRQTVVTCTQCGAALTPDSKFCTACGSKISG